MRVKPAPGRAVRDPNSMALLPEAGRDVPNTAFWQRRLRDGDVVQADTPEAKQPEQVAAKEA